MYSFGERALPSGPVMSATSRQFPSQKLIAAFQASGGGPSEDNVTGFLVRSLASGWTKHSVLSVDAGSHLASITRLLEHNFPLVSSTRAPRLNAVKDTANGRDPADEETSSMSSRSSSEDSSPSVTLQSGPFAGLSFPHESARANALHVVRECVSTYLITHPHLDHMSAFAINTAAFHNTSRPKRLAALPSTVNAIKTHIFNNVIWPNLTDEDGGVGFVTFQRLTEGGNLAVGDGAGRGYMEVCDGLCVKGMKISHGHCHRSAVGLLTQRGSDVGLSEALLKQADGDTSPSQLHRRSSLAQLSGAGTPGAPHNQQTSLNESTSREVVVDSTAYFIRDDATGREILVFGDVEPDSLSMSPRTAQVWAEAAPKIASGVLRAVLIECSYDDSQGDAVLFGHLAPRHLIRELCVLAEMVRIRKLEQKSRRRSSRKRKRAGPSDHTNEERRVSGSAAATLGASSLPQEAVPVASVDASNFKDESGTTLDSLKRGRQNSVTLDAASASLVSPKQTLPPALSPMTGRRESSVESVEVGPRGTGSTVDGELFAMQGSPNSEPEGPLASLTVLIIHVKDTMRDGAMVDQNILKQLREHESMIKENDGVGLGCKFAISRVGGSYLF